MEDKAKATVGLELSELFDAWYEQQSGQQSPLHVSPALSRKFTLLYFVARFLNFSRLGILLFRRLGG
jgi:hypothetical protein